MTRTINYQVVGENRMNCGGCERSVVAALSGLEGVAGVTASHETQAIQLTVSAPVAPETIEQELGELGYEIEPA